jgi:hypothetical protein
MLMQCMSRLWLLCDVNALHRTWPRINTAVQHTRHNVLCLMYFPPPILQRAYVLIRTGLSYSTLTHAVRKFVLYSCTIAYEPAPLLLLLAGTVALRTQHIHTYVQVPVSYSIYIYIYIYIYM